MPRIFQFFRVIFIYLICTVILLDVYLIFLKPRLLQTQNGASEAILNDETEIKTQPARNLRRSCFSDQGRLKSKACTQYYYENSRSHESELFTKRIRKNIVDLAYYLWDRFFLVFEEIEVITRQLLRQSTSIWKQTDRGGFVMPEKSAVATFYDYNYKLDEASASKEEKKEFALSAKIQRSILRKNVKIHASSQEESFINITTLNTGKKRDISVDLRREANNTLKVAKEFLRLGNFNKAKKLLEHARQLDPHNAEVMSAYGEVFERIRPPDYVKAEHYYGKALLADPANQGARDSRRRTLPLVEQIDQANFNRIDQKVYQYYHIPEGHPGLRRLKKEHYFRYVYHTNAIEGNTLSLAQTRSILETRLAVGGKSVLEHNEVLGLDMALKYLNSSLLRKQGPYTLGDLLEIHRRVLGFVDLQEAGHLRNTQVFIADFVPPPANLVPDLMSEFIAWLNAADTQELHPIELAALAHWKLVYIHPFYDGNGRTARLLMNLILMRAGYPPAIVKVEERALYYQLIREANEGDVRPFMRFIAHSTEATIDEFILTAKNVINFEGSLSKPLEGLAKPRVINL